MFLIKAVDIEGWQQGESDSLQAGHFPSSENVGLFLGGLRYGFPLFSDSQVHRLQGSSIRFPF